MTSDLRIGHVTAANETMNPMDDARLGKGRTFTSMRLLAAAGVALALAAAGVWVYPYLAAGGTNPAVLTGLRAVVIVCLVAVVVLPVAAIVRRLAR